jgi:multimeric flavodoxin WrbA/putative sterol carrier protein
MMASFRSPGLRAMSLAGMLLMGLAVHLLRERNGISPVIKGYLLYLIINTVTFWFLPGSITHFISNNPTAFLYGCLCAVAVVPMVAVKQYFTEYFARKTTSPAVWGTDIFKKINRNMTWMWTGIFAASAIIALIPRLLSLQRNLTGLVLQIVLPLLLMLLVGIPFNKRYPQFYQRKVGIGPGRDFKRGAGGNFAHAVASQNLKSGKEGVMSNPLKVVAVNGSPHQGIGNTSLMTQMMAPVLAKEGIDLEEIFLARKRIEYCVGCAVCLEKGKCWRQDDHPEIIDSVLRADAVILASPVYFKHVTAQMKAFIDRSLGYGHKPRTTWKPGLAITVSAGMGETATAGYLAGVLRVYGAFSVGTLTAIATAPGAFMGKDLLEARAKDLALDLARAIKEKRRFPATENDLFFYLFMRHLVEREKEAMHDDYEHWTKSGLFEGFGTYVNQTFAAPPFNPELRKEWIRDMISKEVAKTKGTAREITHPTLPTGTVTSCQELLKRMPLGFNKQAAGNLNAVYQFEISGSENFTAHLNVSGGRCIYAEGPHEEPDVTIKSPADVWLAISKGELDGQAAFMAGKYKVEGDLGLLVKIKTLFSP